MRGSDLLSKAFSGKLTMWTNTISGMLMFTIGDYVEQRIELRSGEIPSVSTDRLTRMGIVGASQGPPHVLFYRMLDRRIKGEGLKPVFKKILADQLIGCPLFSVQFYVGMNMLEGKSLKDTWTEFNKKFPKIYVVDWMVWPPCQFINFLYIPPAYRVLFVNVVTTFWNVFLSYMKHYVSRLKSPIKPGHHHLPDQHEKK